ncbi:MAG: hypothetical protein RMJ96_01370 [Candidatus Bipolaricaulota bacterium]|nr:hypothetical protein [Candidatus Bipolaricaulota bacterium]
MARKLSLLIGCTALAILLSSSLGVTQGTTFTLTVAKAGSGSGTVTSSPAGINCGASCSATFPSGTVVTLTAVAATGSTFTGWGGACSGTGTCTVTMDSNKSVTATFAATFTLTVTKAGGGSGTVTSSPAGINCGASCSATFPSGTVVTLTATPERGSIFDRWSGACTGTSTTCSITMDANRSVTATFLPTRTLGYTGDVEGTDGKDEVFQPGATVTDVTIRGDGNGNFADGPNACPASGCGNDKIIGTVGDDTVFGDDGRGGLPNTGHDWIIAGDGNDFIDGEAGDDQIFAGEGDDLVEGRSGNDRIEGGNGNDILQGGSGDDRILGGLDDDTIEGGSGNDILIGGDGDDLIDGGQGNDWIEGGRGTDTLSGGGGNDTFLLRPGDSGSDTETIVCTQEINETGKILLRGSRLKGPWGRYSDTVVRIRDGTSGIFEILTGPGTCIIRRG